MKIQFRYYILLIILEFVGAITIFGQNNFSIIIGKQFEFNEAGLYNIEYRRYLSSNLDYKFGFSSNFDSNNFQIFEHNYKLETTHSFESKVSVINRLPVIYILGFGIVNYYKIKHKALIYINPEISIGIHGNYLSQKTENSLVGISKDNIGIIYNTKSISFIKENKSEFLSNIRFKFGYNFFLKNFFIDLNAGLDFNLFGINAEDKFIKYDGFVIKRFGYVFGINFGYNFKK